MTLSRSQPYVSRHAAPTPLARWAVVVAELSTRPRSDRPIRAMAHRPLWAALAVLTALSLRQDNSARPDEALGLYTGAWIRRSWATGEEVYSHPDTFFGGVPTLYPPLASVVESAVGLAGARLLSLAVMAAATVAVFVMTDTLMHDQQGWHPRTFAALAFATSGPVIVLAHLAIHQSFGIALLLLGLAWALRSVRGPDRTPRALAASLGAGVVLGLAGLVSYSTLLALPVALALVLSASPAPAAVRRDVRIHQGVLLAGMLAVPMVCLSVTGTQWLTGMRACLVQVAQEPPAVEALVRTVGWTLVPLGLALAAARLAPGACRRLLQILAIGVLILVARQALAGGDPTAYLGLAVAFAAPGAGFVLATMAKVRLGWVALVALGYAALVTGMAQAQAVFHSWPDTAPLVRQLSYAVDAMPWVRMVGEGPEPVQLALWNRVEPWQVLATYPGSFRYGQRVDLEALRAAMADNYVQVVFFDGSTEAGRSIDPSEYGFRLTDTVPQSHSTAAWRIYQRFDAVPNP